MKLDKLRSTFKLPNIKLTNLVKNFKLKSIKDKPEPKSKSCKSRPIKGSFLSLPSLDSFTNISTLHLFSKSKSSLSSREKGELTSNVFSRKHPVFPIGTSDVSENNSPAARRAGVKLTQDYYFGQIFQSASCVDVVEKSSRYLMESKSVYCNPDITYTRSVQNSVKRDVSNLRRIRSSNNVCQDDINWVQFVSNMNRILDTKMNDLV